MTGTTLRRCALDDIRKPNEATTTAHRIGMYAVLVLLGVMTGVFQKLIDGTAINDQPYIFQVLDIGNYFGRLAIWILLATVISVSAPKPLEASMRTFLFLISMVASYYLYCNFVSGFLPTAYMMVWIVLSFVAAPLAWVCWYAKGEGIVAIAISSIILGVLFAQAFIITQGLFMTHMTEVITWVIGVAILYRKPQELALTLALSIVVAIAYQLFIPYWG